MQSVISEWINVQPCLVVLDISVNRVSEIVTARQGFESSTTDMASVLNLRYPRHRLVI